MLRPERHRIGTRIAPAHLEAMLLEIEDLKEAFREAREEQADQRSRRNRKVLGLSMLNSSFRILSYYSFIGQKGSESWIRRELQSDISRSHSLRTRNEFSHTHSS